jgi:GNAT superfamily N-acetyltransferase
MIEIVRIIGIHEALNSDITPLLVNFRKELALLKKREIKYSLADAEVELSDYFSSDYEFYVALKSELIIGYAILKIFDETVWLDQLYVQKEERRKSVASQLLNLANKRASDYGKETAFINVHPNNHKMIKFLANNGYNVLNLLEVRKQYNNESIKTKTQV